MSKQLFDVYYDARSHFRQVFAAWSRRGGLRAGTHAAVGAWIKRSRGDLAALLGLDRMQGTRPRPRRTETFDCTDHIREHWLIETQRGVTMPFFLLRPKGLTGPAPAVICPHGHCSGGKMAVAGVRQTPELAQTIAQHNYDYGVQLARAGFLAFCPDARGFGQRQEAHLRGEPLQSSCHALQMMGLPLGQPLAGAWTFDLMRLADHILSREDVRPGGLGCAGLSGGGLQTLFLSALDTRVTCAVVSGYFYGVRQSLLELPQNCACNIVPGLWEHFDMGDLGAMIAPRPLLIESADDDPLNGAGGIKNVRSQMAITRKAYRALKSADRLAHDVFSGGHRWNGVRAIPWMKRWLVEERAK